MSVRPFHVAFPVKDLDATVAFYTDLFGCTIGRSADTWVDFDLYGHQLSAHLAQEYMEKYPSSSVDGKQVPVRHWGVILEWEQWHELADLLRTKDVDFIIEPYIRFAGQIGEQATMFFLDPSGNALEFKAFKDDAEIFRNA